MTNSLILLCFFLHDIINDITNIIDDINYQY